MTPLRHLHRALLAVLASAFALAGATGCTDARTQRRLDQARYQAALLEQRTAALDQQIAQLRGVVVIQQILMAQTLAQRATPPADPRVAAGADAHPSAKPLVDLYGRNIPALTDEPALREILNRIQAIMGRPLTWQERQTLNAVIRRPRSVDATDPWGAVLQ
jgi:hypothetical protein